MTTIEAAAALGIRPATVRQAIRAKRLTAVRYGRDWWIESTEVERYANARRPAPKRPA